MTDFLPPDHELIPLAKNDDRAAFQTLVERYLPEVYRFCHNFIGNTADAEDATQETFVKAWRNIRRFHENKSFKTWLFAIAKNSAIDIMRKRRSVPFSRFDTDDAENVLVATLADPEPLPEELFARKTLAKKVRKVLAELPPRDRTILSLRYDEELSFEDISRILSMPANTIRSLHRRALIALRKKFERP
ncbi:sigma-70 family RNA polymerase sigma factor [Patescibacteria group bacterium]|nr:sigma-70 family RNA polymerase sigma factor [Patescibacteria group bacterium]